MRAVAAVFIVAGVLAGPGALSAHADVTWSASSGMTEGSPITVTINRDPLFDPASYTVTTGAPTDTATPGSAPPGDYTPGPYDVTFGALESRRTVTIDTTQDTLDEADETVTITLASGMTGHGSQTPIIKDDDASPTITVGDASVTEGTGATPTTMSVPVTLSAASGRAVTATFSTADGTAIAGQDYTAKTDAPITIPAGQMQGTIVVDVIADDQVEPNETFTATLANPSGATLSGTGVATGTINNDDAPPTLAIAGPAPTPEGSDGLTTPFGFTITLSRAMSTALQVSYATKDGSATAPADYSSTGLTVTFAPGETQKIVTIPVVADRAQEPNENFSVSLSETGGLIATVGEATAIIGDDDTPAATRPPTGGGPTPLPVGDTTGPRVKLSKITSSRGVMRVTVTCPVGESRCRGTMTVFNVPARKSKVKALRREVKLASSLFVLEGGERARLTLRPSKRAGALIRRARAIRTRGYAVARDAAGNVATARTTGTVRAGR